MKKISSIKLFFLNPVYFKHLIFGFLREVGYTIFLRGRIKIKGKIFDSNFSIIYRSDRKKGFVVEKGTTFDGSIMKNSINLLQDGVCHIGKNCYINGVTIVSNKGIEIRDNVVIGFGTRILDSNIHPINGAIKEGKIIIEDGVWVSSDVTILKGVRIGKNSVVGARTVVTKDIPAGSLAVGNPMRVIKNNNISS